MSLLKILPSSYDLENYFQHEDGESDGQEVMKKKIKTTK